MSSPSVKDSENPYRAIPGQGAQDGGGNPANRGFSNGSVSTQFGPIADMIVAALRGSLMKGLGIGSTTSPTFSRAGTSDYAAMTMRERQEASEKYTSGVYGGNKLNSQFGKLGENALFQQYGTDAMSGGSRVDSFNQVLGRFGQAMGGGSGAIEARHNLAAQGAANVVRNMESNLTDKDGFWDYGKTSGFNREETMRANIAVEEAFGDIDSSMSVLSKARVPTDEKKNQEVTNELRSKMGKAAQEGKALDTKEMEDIIGKSGASESAKKAAVAEIQAKNKTTIINDKDLTSVIDKASGGAEITKKNQEVTNELRSKMGKAAQEGKPLETKEIEDIIGKSGASESAKKAAAAEIQAKTKPGEAPKVDDIKVAMSKASGVDELAKKNQEVTSELKSKMTKAAQEGKPLETKEIEDIIGKSGASESAKKAAAAEIQAKTKPGEGLNEADFKGIINKASGGNDGDIEAANKQISKNAKLVREAGNMFGPDKPFGELMDELKVMTDGSKNMSTGDITSALQETQAMAKTVDMSNEAFSNYMKVIGQIKKGNGYAGSTKDLAVSSMEAGAAQEKMERAAAKKEGVAFTGKTAEENAMNIARVVTDVTGSEDHAQINSAATMLSQSGKEDVAVEVLKLKNAGKNEEAKKLSEQNMTEAQRHTANEAAINAKNGAYSETDQKTAQDLEKKHGIKQDASQERELAAKQTLNQLFENEQRNTQTAYSKLAATDPEKAKALKEKVLSGQLNNNTKQEEREKIELEIGIDKGMSSQVLTDLESQAKNSQNKEATKTSMEMLDPKNIEKTKQIQRQKEETEKDIENSSLATSMSGASKTVTETIVQASIIAAKDIKAGGGELNAANIQKALEAGGKGSIGNEKTRKWAAERAINADAYHTNLAEEIQKDPSLKDASPNDIKLIEAKLRAEKKANKTTGRGEGDSIEASILEQQVANYEKGKKLAIDSKVGASASTPEEKARLIDESAKAFAAEKDKALKDEKLGTDDPSMRTSTDGSGNGDGDTTMQSLVKALEELVEALGKKPEDAAKSENKESRGFFSSMFNFEPAKTPND